MSTEEVPGGGREPGGMAPPGSGEGGGGEVPPRSAEPGGEVPPRSAEPGGEVPPRSLEPGGEIPPRSLEPGGEVPPARSASAAADHARRRDFPIPLALRELIDAAPDMTPRPASASATELSQVMEIEHANNAGYVHGGTILRLVDGAAGIAAIKHARRRVVTAAIDEVSFLAPVFIGDVLMLHAMVNDVHRTSMEVGVRVDVETLPNGERRHVASAHLVYVALDAEGQPTPAPPVIAETADERRRQAQARIRREQRLLRKAALRRAEAGGGAG